MYSKHIQSFVLTSKILLYASIAYIGSITILGFAFLLFGESILTILFVMLLAPVLMISLPAMFISLLVLLFLGSFRPNDEMVANSKRIVPEISSNFFGWMMTGYVVDFRKVSEGDIIRGYIVPRIMPGIGITGLSCLYLGLFFVVAGITGIFDVSDVNPIIGYASFGTGLVILLPFYIMYKLKRRSA
jgi:hypothetical protein